MTIKSMYMKEEVYTENMDEFKIPCYTITGNQKKNEIISEDFRLWHY